MKTKANHWLTFTILLNVMLAACGSGELNKKAAATATDFYKDLQKKDYAAAVSLCSDKAFATDSKAAWAKELEKNSVLLGDIKSYTKTSDFNISTSTTNGTTVALAYEVVWQYGKSTDSLYMTKEADGSMKIYHYGWIYKDAKYLSEVNESEQVTATYMDAVKAGNVDAATALCSAEALKITPKQNWINFLNTANNKLGTVSAYSIIRDSSMYHIDATGDAGKGNYYDVFVQSNRGGKKVMEKIVFYQKNYDTPVKLTGHYFL